MSNVPFDETKHARDNSGRFAEKGPAGEADDVELTIPEAGWRGEGAPEPALIRSCQSTAGFHGEPGMGPQTPDSPMTVESPQSVKDSHDDEVFDEYNPAADYARHLADKYGYPVVVTALRHYRDEDVYDGDISYLSETYTAHVFGDENELSNWAQDKDLSGEGSDDVLSSPNDYQDPVSGEYERLEAYVHRPVVPATERMAGGYVPADQVREGNLVVIGGHMRSVLSTRLDYTGDMVIETDDDFEHVAPDEKIMVYQPNVLSEDEFERRFKSSQPESGGYYEFDDVKDHDPNHVWSVVEGDDGSLHASPGFNTVNNLGYLTTENPWTDESHAAELYRPEDGDR